MVIQIGPLPPTIPLIASQDFAPETIWLLGIGSALLIFSFAAAALLFYRKTERGSAIFELLTSPSIPQAVEFDPGLSSEDRGRELRWIRSLMDAPAYEDRDRDR